MFVFRDGNTMFLDYILKINKEIKKLENFKGVVMREDVLFWISWVNM